MSINFFPHVISDVGESLLGYIKPCRLINSSWRYAGLYFLHLHGNHLSLYYPNDGGSKLHYDIGN